MVECRIGLRRVASTAGSVTHAADAVVRYLRDHLVDKSTGQPSCALVRYYQTLRFDQLEPDVQEIVAGTVGTKVASALKCLTLLGTAGVEPEWNDPRASLSHRVLPLLSGETVRSMPMVHQLLQQLGVEVEGFLEPHPEIFTDQNQHMFNVFYVADARGSPHIPAQDDFVHPYGIRSVLGFGGWLPEGELFVVVLFSRVPISRDTADLFRSIALSVKLAMLPPGEAKAASLNELLTVSEQTVRDQFVRLEQALAEAQDRAAELARSRAALEESEALKTAMVNSALDAVVTMDDDGHVVEFNPAAERIFGYRRDDVVGRPLADAIIPPSLRDAHRQGFDRYLTTGEGNVLGRRIEVPAMRRDGSEFPVELTVTRVALPGPAMFTGFLRDITEQVKTRLALEESSERIARVARTLQASLLPPHLPEIPGLELAAEYCPAGTSSDVGGDFYDVFQTAPGEWCCTMGDVCGKGPEAAAVTALARYTLRAAAMRESQPSRVLAVLNEAMLRQHPERFCTVVYARFREHAGGRQLTLASGGHPLPLLVRPDGSIIELCEPGTAIGLFADPDLHDRHYELETGDTVVFFTDGLVEVRGPGWERPDALLREELTATLGADATTVASHIAAVRDREPLRWSEDDVAVLVVRALPYVPTGQPPDSPTPRRRATDR